MAIPNEVLLNDFLSHFTKSTQSLIDSIERNALFVQQVESEKIPALTRPTTFNLTSSQFGTQAQAVASQILRREQQRDGFSLINLGPGDLIWSNTVFDPNTILTQFSDPSHPSTLTPLPNQAIDIGYVPSGGNISIETTDALWGYSVGGACLLTIVETLYLSARSSRAATMQIAGLDGAIGQGYGTVQGPDGNPVASKKIV